MGEGERGASPPPLSNLPSCPLASQARSTNVRASSRSCSQVLAQPCPLPLILPCVCVCVQTRLLRLLAILRARLLCPGDSSGNTTGVCSHSLLQGIFPTQRSNPSLLHCRQSLYYLSHQGSRWKSLLSSSHPSHFSPRKFGERQTLITVTRTISDSESSLW